MLCKICSLFLVTVKVTVFWDVLLCTSVDRFHHFRGNFSFHIQGRRGQKQRKLY
jgi:hypothetical protein